MSHPIEVSVRRVYITRFPDGSRKTYLTENGAWEGRALRMMECSCGPPEVHPANLGFIDQYVCRYHDDRDMPDLLKRRYRRVMKATNPAKLAPCPEPGCGDDVRLFVARLCTGCGGMVEVKL